MWPNSTGGHSCTGILKSSDAYGLSVAASRRCLSLSKYLDLAMPSEESMSSLKRMPSLFPPFGFFPPVGVVYVGMAKKKFLHTFLWDLSICRGRLYRDMYTPSCHLASTWLRKSLPHPSLVSMQLISSVLLRISSLNKITCSFLYAQVF